MLGEINALEWGKIIVSGAHKKPIEYKDAKLWPGGSRSWDWSETNTQHTPGIQLADVEEIVSKGIEYIVLSKGMNQRLNVPTSTVEYLREKGITVIVQPTKEAVGSYNDLIHQNKRVGGLFHSTC